MNRRRLLSGLAASLGLVSLPGCAGVLPSGTEDRPAYPGGTLVVENESNGSLEVTVSVVEERWSASLDTTISGGETLVQQEFVTGSPGDVVTLSARIGDDGEPTTFQFLPAGGEGDAPPEVARLTIENDVEAEASWTATEGT